MKKQLSLFALAGFGLVNAMVSYAALPQLQPADGEIGGHGYVDLGLPSGLLWATCNLGAETPFGNGDLYAWGEVEPRATQDDFEAENYLYFRGYDDSRGSGKSIWTIVEDLGDNISATEYDAAAVKWGNGWRMPTASELRELIEFADGNPALVTTWHEEDNVSGMALGDRLFLTAGYDVLFNEPIPGELPTPGSGNYTWKKVGQYSSSNVTKSVNRETGELYTFEALNIGLHFMADKNLTTSSLERFFGQFIRPVYGAITNNTADTLIGGGNGQSGIAEAVAEGAKVGVRVVGGSLVMTGAPEGASVAVYDLAGRRVMASVLNGHTVDLPALTPGVYIATVAGKSVKIRL